MSKTESFTVDVEGVPEDEDIYAEVCYAIEDVLTRLLTRKEIEFERIQVG